MMQSSLFDLLGEDNPFKETKADDYYWSLKDLANVSKNNKKVFSCFACGGGSTMGYKLAGYDVIGCCEIDPKMNEIYIQNNHPKHNFLMENVEGLLNGNAWEYVIRIYKEFRAIGYVVNHWLLKGETMGVPQARHRVVFVAHKEELHYPELKLCFNYEKVPYERIKTPQGLLLSENRTKTRKLLANVKYGETDLSGAHKRLYGKDSFFNSQVLYDNKVVPTIRAGAADYYRYGTFEQISQGDIITASTFPQDYNFGSNAISNVCYICGMSVPPIMIKRVATEIYKQWFILENSHKEGC